MTNNRKNFSIDINQDEDGRVDVRISSSEDLKSEQPYTELVKILEGVFNIQH
tara:strand:+ start:4928 stop:5083 length:156 start_codon:yes stop_codon:yes gene_type:complete